jgi:hypothetical protein
LFNQLRPGSDGGMATAKALVKNDQRMTHAAARWIKTSLKYTDSSQ